MKRRFNIKAVSGTHTATVSVLVETDGSFMRHESDRKARDVTDSVIKALQDWYRPTKIKLR